MPTLRSDAARSRARILDVARGQAAQDLRLNRIAHEAGVGVATVYRHFPTVHALVEALTAETVQQMLAFSHQAASAADPDAALSLYLQSVLTLQLDNDGLQTILLAPDDETAEMRAAKSQILAAASTILQRAKAAGAVRHDLPVEQLEHLVCGIEHAVRLGVPDDREPLLRVLLAGIRPA